MGIGWFCPLDDEAGKSCTETVFGDLCVVARSCGLALGLNAIMYRHRSTFGLKGAQD